MHDVLRLIIPITTDILDLIGILIIIFGSIKATYGLIVSKFNMNDINIKLNLAKALELGLEFKLAAEILKTVLIHSLDELIILSAIVVLRVIMTFVIHWEIDNSEIEKSNSVKKKEKENDTKLKNVAD